MITCLASVLLLVGGISPSDTPELLKDARAQLANNKVDLALQLVNRAIENDPKSADAYFLRGIIREEQRQHAEAIADFTKTIELEPRNAQAYNHRGSERFKQGGITESIKDFDKFMTLKPEEEPGHWR